MPRQACSAPTTGRQPLEELLLDGLGEPVHPLGGLGDPQHVLLEGDALGRIGQHQARDPAPVRIGPGRFARVADVVAQQQGREPVAHLALHRHRVLARTHQIAHGLIGHIGHVDRFQLPGACQPGQLQTIAPVGLDPIAYPPRGVRRRHHPALVPAGHQPAVNHIPARARLVDKHQRPAQRFELAHRPGQRLHVPADAAEVAHLAALLGAGDVDRFLVHVHSHIQLARLAFHGLPPYWVDTIVINVWLGVARRHAIHDTPEAGRLTTGRSHSV
jgi:hypothetical protein